jgi:hypothetical protein
LKSWIKISDCQNMLAQEGGMTLICSKLVMV